MMSSGSCNKVNSSTQVNYNFVEARSIVGQEDTSIEHLSQNVANLSLRKQNKGVRPPLVGQASSSSNDSVSLPFERSVGNNHERHVTSPSQNNELNQGNDSATHNRLSYLPSRNDYISQKPPEGSYCHIYSSSQPTESNHELTRVRSSSSASSVTSSRPLEWDNGADVGYSQCLVSNGKMLDPNMSTVERMALVSSTKLLRRSDPEGTPGGIIQQTKNLAQPKMRVKNKFGHPNAESTPVGTNVPSDASPDTVDFISPIPYERREDSEHEMNSSESEAYEQKISKSFPHEKAEKEPTLFYANESTKRKMSLFPEMVLGHSMPNDIEKGGILDENISNNAQNDNRTNIVESSDVAHNSNDIHLKLQQFNTELISKLKSVDSSDTVHKKLSSSLENISNVNNIISSNERSIPNTLPRSHSQTDLFLENVSHENVLNNKGLKGNIVVQNLNLFKNKSASSSSVATVVHRKGDSPKHAVVQTSILKKQSVGTQVCESIERSAIKSKLFTLHSETPHLPKVVLTQQLIKKSNYFDFEDEPSKYKKASIDTPLVVRNENCGEKDFHSNNVGTHFHNGILCKGAHKKSVIHDPAGYSNQFSSNIRDSHNCGPDSNTIPFSSNNQQQNAFSSASFNKRKYTYGSMVDSVESSVKSGGCGTDQQYSVTVEDRVNSFEYLPGHIYENNERQQPINSGGTSSMSIENQTSNNASIEEQNKIWESSDGGSISSTFEKDAQRGADMLSNFVKGAYENDTILKRKLIRRVVDKLISKNNIDKNVEPPKDLLKNTPWVPPRPPNPVQRNVIKTHKSKVPCEFSSHSEKSGTTNTSSECFIPRQATKELRSKCVPSFFQDGSCHKYQGELSSTSNVTPENQAKTIAGSPKSHKFNGNNVQKTRKIHISKTNGDSQYSKVSRTSNWKEPATKTEKLIEERRKIHNDSSGSQSSISQLLDMERENKLFWIRSEIEHLSNLKLLLEKQEELKRGLKKCKSKQDRYSESNVLKDMNRLEKEKTKAATSAHADGVIKKSSLKTKSNHPSKLNEWLKVAVSKSHDIDLDGWASHHYENYENIKSCLKRKNKHHPLQNQPRTSTTEKDRAIYDEPPMSSKTKPDLKLQEQSNSTIETTSQSASMDKECNRRGVPNTVGGRERGREAELGCQCQCRGKCKCCAKHKNTQADDSKKQPLGYYIVFDKPKKRDGPGMEKNQTPVNEMGTSWPGERREEIERQSRVERLRAGADNVSEKTGLDGKADIDPESSSSESESGSIKITVGSKNPIFKGGAGELQYNLLHNRPSYVSRAEDRRQCIAQMQYLREMSSQNKRRLLSLTQPNPPPPLPIKIRRVFSQHKMRQMTEKKYRQLSEVREKLQDTKKKESYRTNRLMAEIFKKNLQKRALKGEVNLSNSVFVISSL